ncbi:MAG: HAMP domain-containing histidine kinase [Acidimicrobiaceae bacterium]|nr:HAMP domain-containing histidine kinase [Acidimicrobiaceae bacterium]
MTRRFWKRSEWLGPLGVRLALASILVAMTSVILLASLTLLLTDIDLTNANNEQEQASTTAIVNSVRATYLRDKDRDWKPRDLAASRDLVRAIGVGVVIRANSMIYLLVPPSVPGGTVKTVDIRVGPTVIATGTFTFPRNGLLPEEVAFRRSIETSVLVASGLALLVALGASIFGTRRIVRPLRVLTAATRRLATGDRASRVGPLHTTGELVELGSAFDTMAGQLEVEDALRRSMVADLAHELRTPLSVLHAQLEDLSVGNTPLNNQAIVSLSEEVHQLTRLIEDLRVLSSAEAAGLTLEMAPLDLAGVASNAAARLAPQFVQSGVDLSVQFSPTNVRGDAHRLEQVIVNLLSNAEKFTPAGGRVRVVVQPHGDQGRVTVSDTGRGIPLAELGSVFGRFYRGTNASGTAGTGVGLAVVEALVSAHGGHIYLTSTPGAGSEFTFDLPLVERNELPPSEPTPH